MNTENITRNQDILQLNENIIFDKILCKCPKCKKVIPFTEEKCMECGNDLVCKVIIDKTNHKCSCCNEIVPMWIDACPNCQKKLDWENFYFN